MFAQSSTQRTVLTDGNAGAGSSRGLLIGYMGILSRILGGLCLCVLPDYYTIPFTTNIYLHCEHGCVYMFNT